jgi:hypothetical protein
MTEDYDVGWGKPPQHSRFKKGRSGSANGRPPKARNLKTDLVAELGARIRVREGDREVSISKQEAFIKTLVARALKGDARASSLLVGLMAKLLDVEVDLAERGVDQARRRSSMHMSRAASLRPPFPPSPHQAARRTSAIPTMPAMALSRRFGLAVPLAVL